MQGRALIDADKGSILNFPNQTITNIDAEYFYSIFNKVKYVSQQVCARGTSNLSIDSTNNEKITFVW